MGFSTFLCLPYKGWLCFVEENAKLLYHSFWSYELSKRVLISDRTGAEKPEWMTILLCGGIAGVVTWASVFPLGKLTVVSFPCQLILIREL
jgi:hypothetical protein